MLHTVLLLSALYGLPSASPIRLQKRDYPNPEPCTGNCSWIHDPSIIKQDDTYYRFSTSGNIAIATAPSLNGPWEYQGALLDHGTSVHPHPTDPLEAAEFDIWAPDVVEIGDLYYAFYSVSRPGYQDSEIGVAVSDCLDPGTWTDHGSINLPKSANYNLIDPNLFRDPQTGQMHFTFGSYWNDIYQIPLPVSQKESGPPLTMPLNLAKSTPKNIISNTTQPHPAVAEGAFQFKYSSNNLYYVFFSVGQCCLTPAKLAAPGDEYRIVVCRADAIEGPYVDKEGKSCLSENGGTTVLGSHGDVYAPGGQGVLVEGDGGGGNGYEGERVVLYYHYVNKSVGYNAEHFFFGFNYLGFESGWPVVV